MLARAAALIGAPARLACRSGVAGISAFRPAVLLDAPSASEALYGSRGLECGGVREASSSTSAGRDPPAGATRGFAAQAALAEEDDSEKSSWTPPPLEVRPWQRYSLRSGLIAVKAGMTQTWDEWGVRVPLTVLWIDNCQVTQVKSRERGDVTDAVQVGSGAVRAKRSKGRATQIKIRKRVLHEFPVTPDGLLPPGLELRASHFVAGQRVDVTGTSIGKGFQGAMKRHGFKGGDASHGNSLAHRALGSTGACQDPGRVEKGKKMPGRMGGKQRTVQNAVVYKIDPARNLVYIRGAIPGHAGNHVFVKDAYTYRTGPERDPASETRPFPTFIGEQPAQVTRMDPGQDPFME